MNFEEALQYTSKMYLQNTLNSYNRNIVPPNDEEELRNIISRDHEKILKSENISQRLNIDSFDFENKVIANFLLTTLIENENLLDKSTLINYVLKKEEDILNISKESNYFQYKNNQSIETYKTVLEVAIDDGIISTEEKTLLKRLREHLGLTFNDHLVIQAQLKTFPKKDNSIHTVHEIENVLKDLNKRGILFLPNKHPELGSYILLPIEMTSTIKKILDIELLKPAYKSLLEYLKKSQLSSIAHEYGLPSSAGTKDELIERILFADISPSDTLSILNNQELYEFCQVLPSVPVSGTKETKILNIIDYFDNLRSIDFEDNIEEEEKLFEFYSELAYRDRENLRSNKIIDKDLEIEHLFEKATHYIFEKFFGLVSVKMDGVEHADGKLKQKSRLLLWDNKSVEGTYTFPSSHVKQFKNYIRDHDERVNVFLIITSNPEASTENIAHKLKVESDDTDIALISADTLKWLAKNWNTYSKSNTFNLSIFNYTGILDKGVLINRLKIIS